MRCASPAAPITVRRLPVLNLVESVALGASLIEPLARPTMVYAGNSALRARVKEIVGNDVPLIAVEGNVRPALGGEDLGPLQAELEALHASTKLGQSQRLEHLRGMEQYSCDARRRAALATWCVTSA